MSIVTRGLSRPIALMNSYGLGAGTSVVIVIDLEQTTLALQMLQDASIADRDIYIEAVDAQSVQLAVIVAKDPEGRLDEFVFESIVASPLQRVTVTDRPISIEVRTVALQMGMMIHLQEVGIEEIDINVEVVDANDLDIDLVVAKDPEGRIDEFAQETGHAQSIDKNGAVT